MKTTIGIDPGNTQSAMTVYDGHKIVYCEKIDNKQFFQYLSHEYAQSIIRNGGYESPSIYIEDIQSMGMAVGQEVFDTAKMIGRIQQTLENGGIHYNMVKRTEIKLHHCNTTRAKDTNIRQALIDRFGDKGTKKEPGFFFRYCGKRPMEFLRDCHLRTR